MRDKEYLQQARESDRNDVLATYRDRFIAGDPSLIYLDGNSLGKLPVASQTILDKAINYEWGERLIRSWNEDWYKKNSELGDKIARITGASAGEIVVTDTTSVNLYKLAYAALKYRKGRTRIVSDELNFPSDLYILEGLVKEFGTAYELHLVPSHDGTCIETSDLLEAIDGNTALVSLSHVAFKSAFMYDMKELTCHAHEKGALVLWDLSHSAGAVPVGLNDAHVDLAVGCTYKYLNGGPGSPAYLFVRKDLQEHLLSPIQGWFGEQDPFDFGLSYRPGEGIRRFLAGTPPMLSLKAVEPALDIVIEAGLDKIREKSIAQSAFFLAMAEEFLYPLGFSPGSPADPASRGSHLSFRHPEAYRLCRALIDPGVGNAVVIPDFRHPDYIRIGITPLYTSFTELYRAVMEIRDILAGKLFTRYPPDREQVT